MDTTELGLIWIWIYQTSFFYLEAIGILNFIEIIRLCDFCPQDEKNSDLLQTISLYMIIYKNPYKTKNLIESWSRYLSLLSPVLSFKVLPVLIGKTRELP